MILTVATMSPSATARYGGKVATVIASSTALTRSIASAPMIASPAVSREQVDPPGERRRATQIRARQALGERKRRLVLADVSVLQARRNDARHARRRQRQPALAGESVALLERSAVNPHPVRENGALGFLDWR